MNVWVLGNVPTWPGGSRASARPSQVGGGPTGPALGRRLYGWGAWGRPVISWLALGLGMEKGKVFAMNFFNSISICSKLLHGPNCISKTWLKKTSYTEESNDVNGLQRVTSVAWVLYLTRHHSASPSLPQIMAWRLGDKPLSEPMVVWRYVAKSPYTHHSHLVAFGPGHRQTLERCD